MEPLNQDDLRGTRQKRCHLRGLHLNERSCASERNDQRGEVFSRLKITPHAFHGAWNDKTVQGPLTPLMGKLEMPMTNNLSPPSAGRATATRDNAAHFLVEFARYLGAVASCHVTDS